MIDRAKTHEELKFWKEVAIFLADCHAGTAECLTTRDPRRLNSDDYKRFLSIADSAAQALEHASSYDKMTGRPARSEAAVESYRKEVVARLKKALDESAKMERRLVRKIKP